MKILTISDVENTVDKDLTPVDMILKKIDDDIKTVIFAGDINPEDSEEFFDMLSKKFNRIIWVTGNHDFFDVNDIEEIVKIENLENKRTHKMKKHSEAILNKHTNINLLYPCGYVEIDNIIIAGISYNCNLNDEIKQVLKINKKRILVTHQPPFGILDSAQYFLNEKESNSKDSISHIGSKEILDIVNEYNPNIHIFGDSHSSGQRKIHRNNMVFHRNSTLFVNTSSVSRKSQNKTTYTGVYGILDTDKMDIELKCLNSRKITCEKCNETAYIPYYWKRDKCSNCYENKSKIFEPYKIFRNSFTTSFKNGKLVEINEITNQSEELIKCDICNETKSRKEFYVTIKDCSDVDSNECDECAKQSNDYEFDFKNDDEINDTSKETERSIFNV